MTVDALIGILYNMPLDIEVVCDGFKIEKAEVNDEYYDGDPCNPNCPVISVVELK